MKRMHVHVSVADLAVSVRFYSALFAAEPLVLKSDYAKWMLDDPRVNFAISQRGTESSEKGVDHLGIQVETEAELAEMHARLSSADLPVETQLGENCCYAKSDKYWSVDPQGVAWESYRTLDTIPIYGRSHKDATTDIGCCNPMSASQQSDSGSCAKTEKSSCC